MSRPPSVPPRCGPDTPLCYLHTARLLVASLLLLLAAGSVAAEEGAKAQMRSLDEQVQEIKSDVLSIAAELTQLEETLLFPSNTQVAVFVSLHPDDDFQLDAIQVDIDGEAAARHVYTWKELEALRKGGVQRIYTGNVPIGEHQLAVRVSGKRGGSDVEASEQFSFRKEVGPKLVEISLADGSGGASIQLGGS